MNSNLPIQNSAPGRPLPTGEEQREKSQAALVRPAGCGLLPPFFILHGSSAALLLACVCLTGCFGFLKPAKATARHFVLTALPAADAATVPPGALAVGVGQVKLPAYLFETSLAIRRGANEIDYPALTLWGERLDTGIQRVVAANLAVLLPTDQVRLSSWRSEDVGAEVYVTIEQFDVDANGRAVLFAWWRVLTPGGDKTLKAGQTRLTREGPSPEANPAGAVATLSELVGELSRQLALTLKETTAR